MSTANVLQRIRERLLAEQHACDGDESYQVIDADDAMAIIDDELAKVEDGQACAKRTRVIRQ